MFATQHLPNNSPSVNPLFPTSTTPRYNRIMVYGTNTGLDAYATATGRTLSGDADVARTVASAYIDGLYWSRFIGAPEDTYGDAWPRTGISGVTDVPERVENATYEAALLYDADSSALTAGGVSNNGSGAVASEKVDVLSVSYHAPMNDRSMADDSVIDNAPRYDTIEALLRPFLRSGWGASVAAFVV